VGVLFFFFFNPLGSAWLGSARLGASRVARPPAECYLRKCDVEHRTIGVYFEGGPESQGAPTP